MDFIIMFSYFEGGVLKYKQIANIDFTALVIAVLNNPFKELFEKIRRSRELGTICNDGEEEYKKLKKNCMSSKKVDSLVVEGFVV